MKLNSSKHYLMDSFAVGADYPDINVQETALGDLEHEPHLSAGLDLVKEALLGMSVHCDEVCPGHCGQLGQY